MYTAKVQALKFINFKNHLECSSPKHYQCYTQMSMPFLKMWNYFKVNFVCKLNIWSEFSWKGSVIVTWIVLCERTKVSTNLKLNPFIYPHF